VGWAERCGASRRDWFRRGPFDKLRAGSSTAVAVRPPLRMTAFRQGIALTWQGIANWLERDVRRGLVSGSLENGGGDYANRA
jgi:hypothetical protein